MTRFKILIASSLLYSCDYTKISSINEQRIYAEKRGFSLLDHVYSKNWDIFVYDAGNQEIMIFGKPNESKKITGIHGYEIKILDSLGRDIEDRSRVSLAKPKPEEIRQPQGFWYILPIKAPYQEKFVISIVENINNQHYETIYSNSLGPIN